MVYSDILSVFDAHGHDGGVGRKIFLGRWGKALPGFLTCETLNLTTTTWIIWPEQAWHGIYWSIAWCSESTCLSFLTLLASSFCFNHGVTAEA